MSVYRVINTLCSSNEQPQVYIWLANEEHE